MKYCRLVCNRKKCCNIYWLVDLIGLLDVQRCTGSKNDGVFHSFPSAFNSFLSWTAIICFRVNKYFHEHFSRVKQTTEWLRAWLQLISQWNTSWWRLQLYRAYGIQSPVQILLVMASWLLEEVPLCHSLSRSFSPLPRTLPFCHVCRGTYRVAAGFLFSGNGLDDWKATWSDLRDTTCRRFIISFPLFFFLSSLFRLWGCQPEVRGEHKRLWGL